jgi:hypothetical protein
MSEKTKFDDYRGGALAAAGFTRVGSTSFPLMQSYDIQAGDKDERLNTVIDGFKKNIGDLWTTVNEGISGSGVSGATFTPSVSDDGWLSWENDRGKPNPPTVNIRGISKMEINGSGELVITYTDKTSEKIGTVGSGGGGSTTISGIAIPISSATEMEDILASATGDKIGTIYKFTGTSTDTYEQGALYIIANEAPDGDEVIY